MKLPGFTFIGSAADDFGFRLQPTGSCGPGKQPFVISRVQQRVEHPPLRLDALIIGCFHALQFSLTVREEYKVR